MHPRTLTITDSAGRVCSNEFLSVMMESLATLRQLAVKLTRSRSDADDLLQATCLRALESAARLRDHSNLAGWLARVMRNLHIDHSRSRGRRVMPLTDRHVAACAPEGIAMWRQVDEADVERVLPRLSPQLRAVWELHHRDHMDQHQIARSLNIPRTTVATRLFRARLAVRRALLERYGEEPAVIRLDRESAPPRAQARSSEPARKLRQPLALADPAPAPRAAASAL